MPELTAQERLQPALLYRLTDDEPEKREEPLDRRVMSKAQLRAAVLQDLDWLFNATRFESQLPASPLRRSDGVSAPERRAHAIQRRLAALPHARRSVVNYGLPAFSGWSASGIGVAVLERSIQQVILDFEPRILPESLRVRAILAESRIGHANVIEIEIKAQLWAQPVPLELLMRREIDLETGGVQEPRKTAQHKESAPPR